MPAEFNNHMKKYWGQRYRLFSLYDNGIQLDEGTKIADIA